MSVSTVCFVMSTFSSTPFITVVVVVMLAVICGRVLLVAVMIVGYVPGVVSCIVSIRVVVAPASSVMVVVSNVVVSVVLDRFSVMLSFLFPVFLIVSVYVAGVFTSTVWVHWSMLSWTP